METFVNFLRDPIWQGISGLVAIAAFLYFLFDRYVTKERILNLKSLLVQSFWTAVICYAFTGFISVTLKWSDGYDKTETLLAWLGTGTIFFVVAMIVQIQESR